MLDFNDMKSIATQSIALASQLAALVALVNTFGQSEMLDTARALAADGIDDDTIYRMMRGNLPRPVIAALIIEAQAARTSKEPIIR